MEKSSMKTPALLIVSLSTREGPISPCGTASQSSRSLAPTQTLCTRLPKKGWLQRGLWRVYANWTFFAHWREFPAWRGIGRSPSFLQRSHRGGGCFVVIKGHDSGARSLSWSSARGNAGSRSACLPCGARPAHLQPWPHVAPVIPAPGASSEQRLCPQRRRLVCFDGRIINVPQLHSCKIPGETRRV